MNCGLCGEAVDLDAPDTHLEVSGWVHGPKKNGLRLSENTGRAAHGACVEKALAGQAPDQETLPFDEEPVAPQMPNLLSKAGVCNHCDTSMKDCAFKGILKCCDKCEHPLSK